MENERVADVFPIEHEDIPTRDIRYKYQVFHDQSLPTFGLNLHGN